MSQIVHVSRLNPKTTEEDFQRFCTRFGNVIECVIYPESDKFIKRSGYVKFASHESAEKMYRQSREETLYIDQTSVDVELPPVNSRSSNEKKKTASNPKKSTSTNIYTLNIEGQIINENELINYLNSKPLSIKFLDTGNAQVTLNDKDLVDRLLEQTHEKFTIKLLSPHFPSKRTHESDQSVDIKRSKISSNSYLTLTTHLESITKLTDDIYEENERLKNEKSLLTISLNQQILKLKQVEEEKSDLVQSLSKTHDIAKCLTNKFKLREEEHKTSCDQSNKKMTELESIIKTANNTLITAKNEIQRLTQHITTLEIQFQELTNRYTQSESKYFAQQQDIERFFSALKKLPTD